MEHGEMVVDGVCLCEKCVQERAMNLWFIYATNSESESEYLFSTANTEEEAERMACGVSLGEHTSYAYLKQGWHSGGCWDVTVYVNGERHPWNGEMTCKRPA